MMLVVGKESTWSIRVLICGYLSSVNFEVKVIDLSAPDYKQKVVECSPSGLVPVLVTETGNIHDSLAISEFFNEISDGSLYPKAQSAKRKA